MNKTNLPTHALFCLIFMLVVLEASSQAPQKLAEKDTEILHELEELTQSCKLRSVS